MTISDRVLNVLVDVSEIEGVRHDPDVRLLRPPDPGFDADRQIDGRALVRVRRRNPPAEFDREEWATPRKIISYMERKVAA